MAAIIRIVVIDDHDIVRSGVVESLSGEEGFEVVGMGRTAEDAVRLAVSLKPDIALLDVNMPGTGIEAVRAIAAQVPEVTLVMFSFRDEAAVRAKAEEAGAAGYLVKGISGSELAQSLRLLATRRGSSSVGLVR